MAVSKVPPVTDAFTFTSFRSIIDDLTGFLLELWSTFVYLILIR
jgi:hypothetical protein